MLPQQYCLRWKHHHSNVQSMFSQLLEKERFCDVTLYCSPSFGAQIPENGESVAPEKIRGVSLRAHRVVLAACSEMLGSLLGAHDTHGGEPVLVIDGAEPKHVRALLDYMYTGEMNVHHSQLASLLKTAEELRIKGLSDIRWSGKDEPPDCKTGAVTATTAELPTPIQKITKKDTAVETDKPGEKFNVNGGPPPLIKLPSKSLDKTSPGRKRDATVDSDGQSPKRQRMTSGTEQTDDEDRDQEWQHGNLDITAERVVRWGATDAEGSAGSWESGAQAGGEGDGEVSDDEWGDAPTDIGSFLDTRLRVDGDNSNDEESSDEASSSATTSMGATSANMINLVEMKPEVTVKPMSQLMCNNRTQLKAPVGPKSGPNDPRFADVIQLNAYLLHGRRPQFWEEDYVKRVMEAVRVKELEMKQAAEILGVSYGTLYGRYRDVYGCINRPYRNARDFWAAKGPSEILDRLQRGEVTLEVAAQALNVSVSNLAAHMADFSAHMSQTHDEKDFEPIPIEIDPSLKMKNPNFNPAQPCPVKSMRKNVAAAEKAVKKILIGSLNDEDPIPATVITTQAEGKTSKSSLNISSSGKWPTIRVASLDSLRGSTSSAESTPATSTSPSALMKSRPDLTIVASKKTDTKKEEENGT